MYCCCFYNILKIRLLQVLILILSTDNMLETDIFCYLLEKRNPR
ncbi:hypothetical protein M124_0521 [Bacteroides fragilis str. 3988T(B)14]|uniref:Uncharacterized protein n=1 Tax=Bacteroides fragilis str. 3988T(B)14 TaxID=1339315 RepID=A0A015SZP2_BACFG|nr:hypothetical protein M124_0521 [Bacteroides fragilis str. 3988T(B)14]